MELLVAAAERRFELAAEERCARRVRDSQELVWSPRVWVGAEETLLAFAVAEYAAGKFCQHVATGKMYWARPEVPWVATSCRLVGNWLLRGARGGV